jgi:hypothetical protein
LKNFQKNLKTEKKNEKIHVPLVYIGKGQKTMQKIRNIFSVLKSSQSNAHMSEAESAVIRLLKTKPPGIPELPGFQDATSENKHHRVADYTVFKSLSRVSHSALSGSAYLYMSAAAVFVLLITSLLYNNLSEDPKHGNAGIAGTSTGAPRMLVGYGEVHIERDGSVFSSMGGDILESGDKITVPSGSSADILLSSGSAVSLSENTEIHVLQARNESGQKIYSLDFNKGKLTAWLMSAESSVIEIHSDTSVFTSGSSVIGYKSEGKVITADVYFGKAAVKVKKPSDLAGNIIQNFVLNKNAEFSDQKPIYADNSVKINQNEIVFEKIKNTENMNELSVSLDSLRITREEYREALSALESLPEKRSAEFIKNIFGRNLEKIYLNKDTEVTGVVAGRIGDLVLLSTTKGGKVVYSGDVHQIDYPFLAVR